MDVSHKKHRPHFQVGKHAEDEGESEKNRYFHHTMFRCPLVAGCIMYTTQNQGNIMDAFNRGPSLIQIFFFCEQFPNGDAIRQVMTTHALKQVIMHL